MKTWEEVREAVKTTYEKMVASVGTGVTKEILMILVGCNKLVNILEKNQCPVPNYVVYNDYFQENRITFNFLDFFGENTFYALDVISESTAEELSISMGNSVFGNPTFGTILIEDLNRIFKKSDS